MNHPQEMYQYHTWATYTILGRIQELPDSVLHQEVNSSFPTIAHALSHMYAVDQMWYLVLTGVSMPEALQMCMPRNEELYDSVEDYGQRYAELSEQYTTWFQDHIDLEQTILLDNPFAGIRDTSLAEIVFHLINHGTYHRGNISTMLRQLGHASIMNDYSLFWYAKPAID
ncbi:putative damage-inducible protein DinB [Paenibacillus amylolyticus]|uniref:Damage-inducible protein DinB n=1 Tax=Paenibacillus amylolyticus TaxID=1451 RepID=A0AAP5H4K6_PAEAM|nr:DinB family protein [Paenibacillus amylolyticus]MDR6723929.1 putative damage-inducible protein DinB [Paenibacillus amylolyticus]